MKINKLLILFAIIPFFCSCNNNHGPEFTGKDVDVFIFAGQSNMEGYTQIDNFNKYCTDENKDYNVFSVGINNVQISYFNLSENNSSNGDSTATPNFVNVKLGQGKNVSCIGPELGFAEKMREENKKDIVIIKYDKGGSSLYTNWISTSRGGTNNLYTGMISYVNDCLTMLKGMKRTPTLRGLMWMQGEQDASSALGANSYENNLRLFCNDFRNDLKDYAPNNNKDDIAFIDAAISSDFWENSSTVNAAKQKIASESIKNFYIETNDVEGGLGLSKGSLLHGGGDTAHYNIDSIVKLGQAYASVVIDNSLLK